MARYRNLEPQAINDAEYLAPEQEETELAPVDETVEIQSEETVE